MLARYLYVCVCVCVRTTLPIACVKVGGSSSAKASIVVRYNLDIMLKVESSKAFTLSFTFFLHDAAV